MTAFGGASVAGAALQDVSFSSFPECMTDNGALVETGEEEEVCLELTDLLLQGLLLLLGWGMAVEEEDEDVEEAEVAAGMLVEGLTVTADEGACSVITDGCEVMPSEESGEKREMLINKVQIRRKSQAEGGSGE